MTSEPKHHPVLTLQNVPLTVTLSGGKRPAKSPFEFQP